MNATLIERVEQVRRAALRLVWLYAAARLVAVVAGAVLLLCLADAVLQADDAALRWLAWLAALGTAAVAAVWLLRPAVRHRPSRVAIARQLERRFPQLEDCLSSAVAFLEGPAAEAWGGSPALRQAVIADAEQAARAYDFPSALDRRALWPALLAAAGVLLLFGAWAASRPATAGLALARLAMPWRDAPWPRRHELVVAAPRVVAAGEAFEVTVSDRRAALPKTVELLVRSPDDSGAAVTTQTAHPTGDRVALRIDRVTRPFAFRVRGGDDDTFPWTPVAVVEPPRVVELKVTVQPPEYTRLPASESGRVVRALAGSTLRFRGQLDRPVRKAAAKAVGFGLEPPDVMLSADRRSFVAPPEGQTWTLSEPGGLWFEFEDQRGLTFGREARIELQPQADLPPTIAWDSPSESSYATPAATLPIRGIVKDDLAIAQVALHYRGPGADAAEETIPLATEAVNNPPSAGTLPSAALDAGATLRFELQWPLSSVAGLKPGDVLALRVTAADFKPQVAATAIRRVTLLSNEELIDRLAGRQKDVLRLLAEALEALRHAEQRVTEQHALWRGEPPAVDAPQSALQAARERHAHAMELLADRPGGGAAELQALVETLEANGLSRHALAEHLQTLRAGVADLNRHLLSRGEHQLTAALKAANEAREAAQGGAAGRVHSHLAAARESLAAAQQAEQQAIRALEQLLGRLAASEAASQLAQELARIRAAQEQIAAETARLRNQRLAQPEASPADRAAAEQQAEAQLELARRLDKLQGELEQRLADRSAEQADADSLSRAGAAARRLALGARMRTVAGSLRQLELQPATAAQREILEGLAQLSAALAPPGAAPEPQPAQAVQPPSSPSGPTREQLAAALAAVTALADEQERLQRETDRAFAAAEPAVPAPPSAAAVDLLAPRQQKLAEQTQKLPWWPGADAFQLATESAAGQMQRAADLLRRANRAADRQATHAASLQQAQTAASRQLRQIAAALAPDDQAAAPAPPADPPAAAGGPPAPPGPSAAEIRLLIGLQETIARRTAELEAQRRAAGALSADELSELESLAQQQGRLAEIAGQWGGRP